MPDTASALRPLLDAVRARVEDAGVFGEVSVHEGRLRAEALGSAAPAEYRLDVLDDGLWVSLVTEDRWLSGSIEGDLVHSGDSLSELLDEELADLGYNGPTPEFDHYRSEDKLFTFRTRVPVEPGDAGSPSAVETACRFLLGYEITFRPLGDMSEPEED